MNAEEERLLRQRVAELESRLESLAQDDFATAAVMVAAKLSGAAGKVWEMRPVEVSFDEQEGATVAYSQGGEKILAAGVGAAADAGRYLVFDVGGRFVAI